VSSLTEQERIGLEEVFLSISTASKPRGKLRNLTKILRELRQRKPFEIGVKRRFGLLGVALKRIKLSNFHHLFPKKNKKKKNLS